MPALVPELSVADVSASLRFYCGLLGFAVLYERPGDGFAYLRRGEADLMIDAIGRGRTFAVGGAPMEHPLGRGINLQIEVEAIAPVVAALAGAGVGLYLPVEERWYRDGGREHRMRQFAVADPDGYLLRFGEAIGARPAVRPGAPKS